MEFNFAEGAILLGILLVTAEVLLLRLSTVVLLFAGVSLILSGTLIFLDMVHVRPLYILFFNVLFTVLFSFIFWGPLKRVQRKVKVATIDTQFQKKEFILDADVNMVSEFEYRFYGESWKVKSMSPLLKGTTVKVDRVDAGVLWVKEVEESV